jgi:hypothetical protein
MNSKPSESWSIEHRPPDKAGTAGTHWSQVNLGVFLPALLRTLEALDG